MIKRVGAAAALAALALGGIAGRVQDDDPVGWRRDLARARTEARQSGKPMFVVFRCER